MNREQTAQVGYIWLRFGLSIIKGGQRVKHLAAINHAYKYYIVCLGLSFLSPLLLTLDYPHVAHLCVVTCLSANEPHLYVIVSAGAFKCTHSCLCLGSFFLICKEASRIKVSAFTQIQRFRVVSKAPLQPCIMLHKYLLKFVCKPARTATAVTKQTRSLYDSSVI